MHVLMVTRDFPPDPIVGVGRYVSDLTQALQRLDIKVTVLAPYRGAEQIDLPNVVLAHRNGPIMKSTIELKLIEWDPFVLLQDNISMTAAMLAEIQHLDKVDTIDVIHCHDYFTFLAADMIAKYIKKPVVMTKHSVQLLSRTPVVTHLGSGADVYVGRVREYFAELQHWSLDRTARIVAVSHAVEKELLSVDPRHAERCAMIHSGTYFGEFFAASTSNSARSRYCSDNEILLLLVGRVVRKKGGDIAIRAVRLLEDLPLKLVFAGIGDYEDELSRLATELHVSNKVMFAGFVDAPDLAELYQAADIVIAPSRDDAFPQTVLEASSLGRLVIASRVGGIVEQIQDNYNGLLIEAGDATALANSIRWALDHSNEVEAIKENARNYATTTFSWEIAAKKYLHEYDLAVQSLGD